MNIDVTYANEQGISVTNVLGVNSSTVAEYAMSLLFAVLDILNDKVPNNLLNW